MLQKAGMPARVPRVPARSKLLRCLFAWAVFEFNGSSLDRSRSGIIRHPRVTGSAGNGAAAQCIPAHPVPRAGWRCVFTSSPFQTTTLEQTLGGFSSPCSQVGFYTLMGSPARSPFFLPQFPQTNNPVVVKPSLCCCHKF